MHVSEILHNKTTHIFTLLSDVPKFSEQMLYTTQKILLLQQYQKMTITRVFFLHTKSCPFLEKFTSNMHSHDSMQLMISSKLCVSTTKGFNVESVFMQRQNADYSVLVFMCENNY